MQVVNGTLKATIIDVRTPAEYEGADARALRGGHIPKSVNIDFDGNYDHDSYRMKSLSELQPLYKALPPADRLITYCQSGARAAYTYLVLRALGYKNVAVYHDGWRVYGSSLNLPVDDETWFDFTKVTATAKAVKELQEKEKSK
jgi:thiosulfate/3-mercaptopyruvate sulfurtransferase